MKDKRYWQIPGATAWVMVFLLSGCASSGSNDSAQALEAEPPALATQDQTAASQTAVRQAGQLPGAFEGELVVITATVKAIDKKNRLVTLQTSDGKKAKIKCGSEVRNFDQIRVGDEVRTSLLETVELFVTSSAEPAAERVIGVERAPLGSRPGFAVIDAVELRATVVAIDYQTRKVTLKGPEGNVVNVTAGPEVRRLNEVKVGDSVLARLTSAVSIEVSKPAAN